MMFKFVSADNSGPPPKRHQSQRACEPCRKRKKRCEHNISSPWSSQSTVEESQILDQFAPPQPPSILTPNSVASQESQSAPQRSYARDSDQSRSEVYSPQQSLQQSPSHPVVPSPQNLSEHENHGRTDSTATVAATATDGNQGQKETTQTLSVPGKRGSRFIGDLSPEGIFLAATSPDDATRGVAPNESVGVWLNSRLSRRASTASPSRSFQSPSNLFYASESSLVQKVLMPVLEQECLTTIPSPARCEALTKIYFEKIHPIFPVIDEVTFQGLQPSDPSRILMQQSICLAASKTFASRQYLVFTDSGPLCSCREFGDKLLGAIRLSIEMGLVTNKIILIQVLVLVSQFVDSSDGGEVSSQFCSRAIHYTQAIGLHVRDQQEGDIDHYSTTLLCCVWAVDRTNAAFHGRPVLMHERDIRIDLEQCFEHQEPTFRLFLRVIMLLDKVIALYRPSGNPDLDQNFTSFEDIVISCGASHIGSSSLATIEALYHGVAILSCRSKTWASPRRSSVSFLRQSLSASILSSNIGLELQDQLILFRFVPYVMSLTMSVAYREMRHGKIPLHRARALSQFQTICDVLSELESVYWSATITAEMGKKMLKEMSRVSSAVTASESRKALHETTSDIFNPSAMIEPSTVPDSSSNDNQLLNNFGQEGFDLSFIDSIGDLDLFGMFDPAFDLDGFDACLEGNLNFAFPNYVV